MPPKSSGSGASKKTYVSSQQHFAYAQAQAQSQDKDRTKVVVRRCPPELPEALFWQSVGAWVTEDTADWKTYKAGRSKKHGTNKESISSTAHIHFKKQEFVTAFAAAFQGHTFRDSKGNHFQVVVEYAPYQRVPPKKPRPDPQSGTIDDDPDFKAFVQKLTEPDNDKGTDPADQPPSFNTTGKGIKKISPLIEDLRRKKEEALLKKKLAKEKKGKDTSSAGAKSHTSNGPTVKAASGTVQATGSTTTPAPSTQASRAARKAASRANAADPVKEVRNGDTATPTVDKPAAVGDSVKKGKKQGKNKEKGSQASTADSAKVPTKAASASTQSNPAAVSAEVASVTTAQKKPVGKAAKVASKPKPAPAPAPQITILAPPKAAKENQQIVQQASAPPPAASVSPETPATAPVSKSAAAPPPGPAVQASTVTTNKPKPIIAGFEDIFEQFAKGTQSKPTASVQDKTGSGVTPKAAVKTVSRGKSDKQKTGGSSEVPTSPTGKTVTAPTAEMAALSVQDKADGISQAGTSRGRGRGHHHPSRGRGGTAARGRGAPKNASSPAPAPS